MSGKKGPMPEVLVPFMILIAIFIAGLAIYCINSVNGATSNNAENAENAEDAENVNDIGEIVFDSEPRDGKI